MAILINKSTKLLVQGITGKTGWFHAKQSIDYNSQVVAGVTPGKGGTFMEETSTGGKKYKVPVFNSVKEAIAKTGANASVIFVPPPVAADTILVQQVGVKSIDADDRKSIALVGSGKGFVASRGLVLKATWKKTSPTDRTRWYDEQGQELIFVPGTVWVEIVPLTANIGLQ
jgi:hypothetical protein